LRVGAADISPFIVMTNWILLGFLFVLVLSLGLVVLLGSDYTLVVLPTSMVVEKGYKFKQGDSKNAYSL
jgi:hypothetical protein